jgi:hypothetical protein
MIASNKGVSENKRVLMFSQRNIFEQFHYRCYLSEFEDLICQMDSVDLLCPEPTERFKYGTRIAQKLAGKYSIGFNPGIPKQKIEKDYDLFFAFCLWPKDILHIESVENWDKCSKLSVCWLTEIWLSDLYKDRYYLDILSKFDLVVMNLSSSVDAVNEKIGDKAFFMPLGIDSVLFCPYPNPPQRSIDMYSIGRRSEITHNKLIEISGNNRYYYIYDTIDGKQIFNSRDHRLLMANTAKRSKFFMVNPGKVNIPGEVTVQSEIGNRFFEGIAAGSIMVGEHPQVDVFKDIFYWPDAVVHLPYDSEAIGDIFEEFEKDPERREAVTEKNILESLSKHDWLYRWEVILQKAGLEPLPGYFERQKVLGELSNIVIKKHDDSPA